MSDDVLQELRNIARLLGEQGRRDNRPQHERPLQANRSQFAPGGSGGGSGVIRDKDGNAIDSVLDGGKRRICTDADLTLSGDEDLASETTLAALFAAFGAEDFASETTLAAILALAGGSGNLVRIADGAGSGRLADVDTSKRLLVSTQPASAPPATTPVNVQEQSDLSGSDDNVFVIPSGETVTIQQFAAGAESGKSSKVELFDDPLGTGVGMALLRVAYLEGNNQEFSLALDFLGDGTAAIRMRRERLDGGKVEVFGAWDGFF